MLFFFSVSHPLLAYVCTVRLGKYCGDYDYDLGNVLTFPNNNLPFWLKDSSIHTPKAPVNVLQI